jgi:hypothetical protein
MHSSPRLGRFRFPDEDLYAVGRDQQFPAINLVFGELAMAGGRNFNLSTITRRDLMSLSEECEKVTGIPYVMRAYRKEAEKILAQ